jgi:hypothetical protein
MDGVNPEAVTLRELTELDRDEYDRVLVLCGLYRSGTKGLEFIKKEWDDILDKFAEGGSHIHCFMPKRTMAVKLGAKNGYGYNSATKQLRELRQKPRIQQLSILRRELRNTLSFHTELESSSSDYESDVNSTLDVVEQTTDASEVIERTNITSVSDESQPEQQTAANTEKKTSVAASLGLDLNALSKQQIAALQFELANESNRKESLPEQRKLFTFDMQNWNSSYTCIPVPKQHASTDAWPSVWSPSPVVPIM